MSLKFSLKDQKVEFVKKYLRICEPGTSDFRSWEKFLTLDTDYNLPQEHERSVREKEQKTTRVVVVGIPQSTEKRKGGCSSEVVLGVVVALDLTRKNPSNAPHRYIHYIVQFYKQRRRRKCG